MKELIILRGLPGAGKSTLAEMFQAPICCADDYHVDEDGNYNWKPENVKKAHSWCRELCEEYMMLDVAKLVVANTNTQEWEMEPYFKLADKYGYRVHTLIVENRHGSENVHNVPDEVLGKMRNRFEVKL